VLLAPAPHQPAGPPLWLAGGGPAAQDRVGRLADGWLPYPPSPEDYRAGWHRVRKSAERAARAPSSITAALYVTVSLEEASSSEAPLARLQRNIERYYSFPLEVVSQVQVMFAGTAAEFASFLEPYVEAGVEHVLLRLADENPSRSLEAVGDAVLPLLRGLNRATVT
jgi:alkanesulfonate monooxygenase SsuD/methylene tetrahydromethanopterin reductase-like flavin-dependent oxidoreductase (luciferase family)